MGSTRNKETEHRLVVGQEVFVIAGQDSVYYSCTPYQCEIVFCTAGSNQNHKVSLHILLFLHLQRLSQEDLNIATDFLDFLLGL